MVKKKRSYKSRVAWFTNQCVKDSKGDLKKAKRNVGTALSDILYDPGGYMEKKHIKSYEGLKKRESFLDRVYDNLSRMVLRKSK